MWSWKPIGPNIEPSPRRVSRTGSSSIPRAPCARRAHRRGATQAERKNLRRALQAKDRSRRIKARRRSVFCVCASRRRQMIGSGDRRISPVRRGESPCEARACTALRSHRRIAHAESSKKNPRAICGSSIALPVPKKPPQEGTPGTRRCSTTQRSAVGDAAHVAPLWNRPARRMDAARSDALQPEARERSAGEPLRGRCMDAAAQARSAIRPTPWRSRSSTAGGRRCPTTGSSSACCRASWCRCRGCAPRASCCRR